MNLKPYAANDLKSLGRIHKEDVSSLRNEFQRDRDRIIHSTSFRRLQYKTQVFVNHEGDMFRNRLTHSIEVSQISRGIARTLGCHEDLVEAIALAHDLGHTPFGHAGQDALHDCMRNFGGFEHNLQSLRVVDYLESHYAAHKGLNLTFETREGILKHCSRTNAKALGDIGKRFLAGTRPSLEAQIVNLADEIAYCHHDIDDGVRSNILDLKSLEELQLFNACLKSVRIRYPKASNEQLVHETIRRMMQHIIQDLCESSQRQIEKMKPQCIDDIRAANHLINFSSKTARDIQAIKKFAAVNIYQHPRILTMSDHARHTITTLFNYFLHDFTRLPEDYRRLKKDKPERIIADYIAGMTDRYALALSARVA
jgi:dGTPase